MFAKILVVTFRGIVMSIKEDMYNRKMIIDLLRDREDLIVSSVFNHTYEDVKFVYEREEWNDPRFRDLLMPYIWRRSPKEVVDILTLPEWDNPKYSKLLVHNIWLYPSDVIIEKIRLSYFEGDKYNRLLTSALINTTIKNIVGTILLFEEYHISNFITPTCLKKSAEVNRLLIEFLLSEGEDLVVLVSSSGKMRINPVITYKENLFYREYGMFFSELREYMRDINVNDYSIVNYDEEYSLTSMDRGEMERVIVMYGDLFPNVDMKRLMAVYDYEYILRVFSSSVWNSGNRFILTNNCFNYGIVNIEENIRLFEEYNLVNYLVPSCFKKHSFVNRLLIEFILSMNMSLISCPTGGGKRHLNSIITASERDFYNRFGMDYRELMLYMGEVLRDEFVKRENNFLSRGNIMVKKMAR